MTISADLRQFADVCAGLITVTDAKWGSSILLSPGFCRDEPGVTHRVVTVPCRITVPGELLRIDLADEDRDDRAPLGAVLRDHIGPTEIQVQETETGLIILRAEA